MRRDDAQRLDDIRAAIAAIHQHLERGELSDGLIFDAIRVRLIEIGEPVKALSTNLLASEPAVPWNRLQECETGWHIDTSTRRTQSWRAR